MSDIRIEASEQQGSNGPLVKPLSAPVCHRRDRQAVQQQGGQVFGATASSVIEIQSTGGRHAELKALVKLSQGDRSDIDRLPRSTWKSSQQFPSLIGL